MAAFIAGHTRTIIDALNNVRASAATRECVVPDKVVELDVRVAEVVGNETRLFPDPGADVLVDWQVFRPGLGAAVFERSGTLCGGAAPVEFVADAYDCILMRPLDPVGQDLYPPLLENRQLTHRDLIRILADSAEARARAIKLVIIPVPSSWLGDAGVDSVHVRF